MKLDALPRLPALIPVTEEKQHQPTEQFVRLYHGLYKILITSFPIESDSWLHDSENRKKGRSTPPPSDPAEYVETRFLPSDAFTRGLIAESFTGLDALKKGGWKANGRVLRPYQQALLAWTAMSMCDQAALLVRSPMGTGKGLIGGAQNKFFRNYQYRLLHEGENPLDIPMGGVLTMRKEHAIQNTLGDQHFAKSPPYTFETSHIKQFYKDLATLHGSLFTVNFSKEQWDALIHQEYVSSEEAVRAVTSMVAQKGRDALLSFNADRKSEELVHTMMGILTGTLVFIPGADGSPKPKIPVPRTGDVDTGTYQGDLMYDTPPQDVYPVKASHKDLLPVKPDPDAQPVEPGSELWYVMGGSSTITGESTRNRPDVSSSLRRMRWLAGDEMGAINPNQYMFHFGKSGDIHAKHVPMVLGLTASDRGREGWHNRSPQLTIAQSIALGVSSPTGYQAIRMEDGTFPGQRTEEAYKMFEEGHLRDEPLPAALGLMQPRDCNSMIVLQDARLAREYALRFEKTCGKGNLPNEVACYDSKAGPYQAGIQDWFNGPGKGKKLFTVQGKVAFALNLPRLQNIEVLCKLSSVNARQLIGRLLHNIEMQGGSAREVAKWRTYFRQYLLEGCETPLAYLFAAAAGIPLTPEDPTLMPLQIINDRNGYEKDCHRPQLKELRRDEAHSTLPPPFKKKYGKSAANGSGTVWMPLQMTNPLVQSEDDIAFNAFVLDGEGLISAQDVETMLKYSDVSITYGVAVRLTLRDAVVKAKQEHRTLSLSELLRVAQGKIAELKSKQRNGNGNGESQERIIRSYA